MKVAVGYRNVWITVTFLASVNEVISSGSGYGRHRTKVMLSLHVATISVRVRRLTAKVFVSYKTFPWITVDSAHTYWLPPGHLLMGCFLCGIVLQMKYKMETMENYKWCQTICTYIGENGKCMYSGTSLHNWHPAGCPVHSGTSLQWTPLGPSWLSCIQ